MWPSPPPPEGLLLFCLLLLSFTSAAAAIAKKDFYPFGASVDAVTWRKTASHDTSDAIDLPLPFPFFGESHPQLFVSNHGVVSFDRGFAQCPSDCLLYTEESPVVAVFLVPNSNVHHGEIYYRTTTDRAVLAKAAGDVCRVFIDLCDVDFRYAFVATWDGVGKGISSPPGNTFQLVLVTDGRRSFAMFNYERITWTAHSGNQRALVGIVGGKKTTNGVRNATYAAGSCTPAVADLVTTSNMGPDFPGRWIYRLDGEEVESSACDDRKYLEQPVKVDPTFVSLMGNVPVRFKGPCVANTSKVAVTFVDQMKGAIAATAVHVGEDGTITALAPFFFALGRIRVEISVDAVRNYSAFLLVVDPEALPAALTVEMRPDEDGSVKVDISWDEDSFPDDAILEVWLNRLDTKAWEWKRVAKLGQVVNNNTGNATLVVAVGTVPVDVVANILHISVERSSSGGSGDIRTKRDVWDVISGTAKGRFNDRIVLSLTLWYMEGRTRYKNLFGGNLPYEEAMADACREWGVTATRVENLPPCPLTEEQAMSDGCFQRETLGPLNLQYHHPGSKSCFRSDVPGSRAGQQCCYQVDRSNPGRTVLNVGPPGGGTADLYSPKSVWNIFGHFEEDVLPSYWCCHGGRPDLCRDVYYAKRPSDTGVGYVGNACRAARASGDPHIVTFDGHDYTFNGHGEYWMVQHEDVYLQARMEPLGASPKATVFTAFVCGSRDTPKIHLEISKLNQVNLYLDDVRQELTATLLVSEMRMGSATVSVHLAEQTVGISFRQGLVVSVKFTADAMSLTTSARQGFSPTRGLLGDNDGNVTNDFRTPDDQKLVKIDSDLKVVHYEFGEKWRVAKHDSKFQYSRGDSYDTFHHPEFTPTFTAPDLSKVPAAARTVCAGDTSCLFDYAATGSLSFANETRQTVEVFALKMAIVNEVIVTCTADIPVIENGFAAVNHYMVNGSARFGCHERYFLDVTDTVWHCQESGVWLGDVPRCVWGGPGVVGLVVGVIVAVALAAAFAYFTFAKTIVPGSQSAEPD